MRSRVLAVLICIAAQAAPALADPPSIGNFYPGTASCGDWVADRQNQRDSQDRAFLLGYVTSAENWYSNILGKSVTVTTDEAGVFGWIDNYCHDNPTDTLTTAAAAFVRQSGAMVVDH
ncbi:MAG: hypothetical protein POH28_00925 [Acidocella sp.]|nr:hypothetical protein [Acidocella sp.]